MNLKKMRKHHMRRKKKMRKEKDEKFARDGTKSF